MRVNVSNTEHWKQKLLKVQVYLCVTNYGCMYHEISSPVHNVRATGLDRKHTHTQLTL